MKNKKWLPENNFLQNLSSKEHYSKAFKNILKEITRNEKSIRQGKICPFCYARNLGIKEFCYKCGKKIKTSIKIFP